MKQMILIIALVCSAVAAQAQDSMTVRMVKASNSGRASIDASLKQFERLFTSSIPFKSFQALGSKKVRLPANGPVAIQGYTLNCRGGASSLSLTLKSGRKQVLQTSVRLQKGKPLVLGGFPAADDPKAKVLLVLTVP